MLEGGSIDVNGGGLCLVTEECLLNPNRNSGRTRQDIEALLRSTLGLQRIVWLPAGMAGDDTDGHIDNLARFVNTKTAVCVVEEDPRDENYLALQENYRRLTRATDLLGRRLDVVPLPATRSGDGGRFAASRKLRQLLYRQRRGAGAPLRRTQGSGLRSIRLRLCFRAAGWPVSTRAR